MKRTVIFICEHGAAKSVIAAAYFNKLAHERNFDIQAIARGTSPDDEMAKSAVDGLLADGLSTGEERPTLLSQQDVANSIALVSFCELPEEYNGLTSIERWLDVPPVSVDYEKARDVMLSYLIKYMDKLERP